MFPKKCRPFDKKGVFPTPATAAAAVREPEKAAISKERTILQTPKNFKRGLPSRGLSLPGKDENIQRIQVVWLNARGGAPPRRCTAQFI